MRGRSGRGAELPEPRSTRGARMLRQSALVWTASLSPPCRVERNKDQDHPERSDVEYIWRCKTDPLHRHPVAPPPRREQQRDDDRQREADPEDDEHAVEKRGHVIVGEAGQKRPRQGVFEDG